MEREYLKYFPKPACYPNQLEAMDAIHRALSEKQAVLFEGACGTGKTLSALAPALHVAKQQGKVVIIATNVHQQMLQFIEEAREIKKTNDLRAVVLKGKILMCPVQDMDYETCDVLRENTYEQRKREQELGTIREEISSVRERFRRTKDHALADLESQLLRESEEGEKKVAEMRRHSCDNLYRVLTTDSEDFRKWLFSGVRSPEEVADWAYRHGMCGYEMLKREIRQADLVICNYHHLLNADILSKLLTWMNRGLEDIIAIFDEAHNLESAARSHSSLTLSENTVRRAIDEAGANSEVLDKKTNVARMLELLLDTIRATYNSRFRFGEREMIGAAWHDIRICNPENMENVFLTRFTRALADAGIHDIGQTLDSAQEFGLYMDRFYREQFKSGKSRIRRSSAVLSAADFLIRYLELSQDIRFYPIINVRRFNNEIAGRLELFACIPKGVTAPLLGNLHSAVLMSATLQPFDMVKTTLGIERKTCEMAYGSTFPPQRRRTLAVAVPPLFAKDRDVQQNVDMVMKVLRDIVEQSAGNVLLFFPSSYEASQYYERLDLGVPKFLDEAGTSAQEIREKFFEVGEKGGKAVLFSYIWGTLTEGVDYRNDRGRTVVIIGVGYPALNDRVRAVEHAYDSEFGKGWDYAVLMPTVRKIRQAMGRVVRSPQDYGVRILLDGRYLKKSKTRLGKYSVHDLFPEDERAQIVDVEPDKVKYALLNFFNDIQRT